VNTARLELATFAERVDPFRTHQVRGASGQEPQPARLSGKSDVMTGHTMRPSCLIVAQLSKVLKYKEYASREGD
jgi:hypothetical protein